MVVAAILVELVTLLFLSAHFRRRCRWTTRDTAVAVLVPGAWIVALYVSKLIIWRYTQGRAVWFTYGSDKGLSNAVIESAIVTLLVAFYLVARQLLCGRREVLQSCVLCWSGWRSSSRCSCLRSVNSFITLLAGA